MIWWQFDLSKECTAIIFNLHICKKKKLKQIKLPTNICILIFALKIFNKIFINYQIFYCRALSLRKYSVFPTKTIPSSELFCFLFCKSGWLLIPPALLYNIWWYNHCCWYSHTTWVVGFFSHKREKEKNDTSYSCGWLRNKDEQFPQMSRQSNRICNQYYSTHS